MFTREREDYHGRGAYSLLAAGRDVMANPHARRLLLVFFLEMLSLAFLGALFPFLARYVGSGLNPGVGTGAVMCMALLSVPVWLRLSRRFGKRTAWAIGMGGKGIGFGLVYFASSQLSALSIVAVALIGSGQACTAVLATSIKADVIDYDELETGERKEGAYFATWNFAINLASAVAIAASGFLLPWAGYRPNAAEQAPQAIESIRLVASALPLGLHAVALLLLLGFRLGPREHERMRSVIESRSSAGRGAGR
jgi:Na+/melibiose symporter-like transporter